MSGMGIALKVATEAAKPLFSYRPYWAHRFGTAPFLPMSRAEMDALGWDACDIVLVTGDAYVRHGDRRPPPGSTGISGRDHFTA
jgi:hypothetical protein